MQPVPTGWRGLVALTISPKVDDMVEVGALNKCRQFWSAQVATSGNPVGYANIRESSVLAKITLQ